jgi:hypothetical protein
MFNLDKWITLENIHDLVFYQLDDLKNNTGVPPPSWPGDVDDLVWQFCSEPMEIRAVLQDGTTKVISNDFIGRPKTVLPNPKNSQEMISCTFTASRNTHVTLSDGRIGTGSFAEDEETFSPDFALQREYGAILGCHIIFPKKKFEVFLTKLSGNGELGSFTDNSLKGIAKKIVQSVEDGTFQNKKWAKNTIGTDISWEKFKGAWAIAVSKHPKLANPGRPPKKPNNI